MAFEAYSPADYAPGTNPELKITAALSQTSRAISVRQLQHRVKFPHKQLITILTRMYKEERLECFNPKYDRSKVKLKPTREQKEFCPLCDFPMRHRRNNDSKIEVWSCEACDLEFEMHEPNPNPI